MGGKVCIVYIHLHKWPTRDSIKIVEENKIMTSSVVGYHIEMPANARLRSSGFLAWKTFLGGVSCRILQENAILHWSSVDGHIVLRLMSMSRQVMGRCMDGDVQDMG